MGQMGQTGGKFIMLGWSSPFLALGDMLGCTLLQFRTGADSDHPEWNVI